MDRLLFPLGVIQIHYDGRSYLAEYMGRQKGSECLVCGKGDNCFTFNIFDNVEDYNRGEYETWGFGRDHLNRVQLEGIKTKGDQNPEIQGYGNILRE